MNWNPFNIFKKEVAQPVALAVPEPTKPDKKIPSKLPVGGGRVSKPDFDAGFLAEFKDSTKKIVRPDFALEIIPIIRGLTRVNPDMGQALNDFVQLANTGHRINFDPGVSDEMKDRMRVELQEASKKWGNGIAGIDGIVNKMFAQVMIGGALSSEWVVAGDYSGIINKVFVGPEHIRWIYDYTTQRYDPYQTLRNSFTQKDFIKGNLIKLNPATYQYYALNGDEDTPYGIPHYMTAVKSISRQETMMKNIDTVIMMLGLMGHGEVLMDKPGIDDGENEIQYKARLESTLQELKDRAKQNFADGLSVGYKDDHEFKFNSVTKDATGVQQIWEQNELQIASGLKFDAAFLGRSYGSGESLITILFTKMLSQLRNTQKLVEYDLKYGYALHLRLKGYKFDYLDVEFKPSTITDDLKWQQANEYKIRNLRVLYADGIISHQKYAEDMGYAKADQKEPRVPIDPDGALAAEKQRKDREAGKDASDRKQRDKAKPQGSKKTPTKS